MAQQRLAPFARMFLAAGFLVAADPLIAQGDIPIGHSTKMVERIDLDTITVWGKDLSDEQEMALRIMKIGLGNERSSKAEDANEIVCFFDVPTGSHMNHLYCGTNWALDEWAQASRHALYRLGKIMNQNAGLPGPAGTRPRTSENIYVSSDPISPAFVEDVLSQLGPAEFNREIVTRAMRGDEMPDNAPSVAELDKFLGAFRAVRRIRGKFDPRLQDLKGAARAQLQAEADAEMARAIAAAGLTVDRYNRISALAEEYVTLRNYLAQRLAAY